MVTSKLTHLAEGGVKTGRGSLDLWAYTRPNDREISQARMLIECWASIIHCSVGERILDLK